MKQTAVEWLIGRFHYEGFIGTYCSEEQIKSKRQIMIEIIEQAKEMEKKQLFLASNTSAKDAYKAGQKTMNCGCYEISDATTYEEWLYEQFKSEEE
jgi:hypothetical protein